MSQDETGLERLVVSGTKSGAGNRLVEEVYFVCYLEVLSGKVAGALYTHSHTHSVWADRKRKCLAFSSRLSPGQA